MDETIAVKLRPVNPETDFPHMAELMSMNGSEPITVEDLQNLLEWAPAERIQQRIRHLEISPQRGEHECDPPEGQAQGTVPTGWHIYLQMSGSAWLPLTNARTKNYGASYLRTNNDSENTPILKLNRKLGYQPEPGKYLLLKRLPEPVSTTG